MSRFFVGLALWALLLALAACGGDSKATDPAWDTEIANDPIDSSTMSEMADTVVSSSSKAKSSSSSVKSSSSSIAKTSSSANAKSSSNKASDSSSSAKSQSSSSEIRVPSSSAKSSSSSEVIDIFEGPVASCKKDSTDVCEYGTLIDSRDGQIYKTVKIGEQWWMAEHLNYFTSNSFSSSPQISNKYGRLYTWAAAMDSAGLWSTNGKGCGYDAECSPTYPVRGVCPEGWHLPDTTEWRTLFNSVGYPAAQKLKSRSDWANINGFSDRGYDSYGFNGLPAGWYSNGQFYGRGEFVNLWTSTMDDERYANDFYFEHKLVAPQSAQNSKNMGFSVRCLKDSATVPQIGYTPPDTSSSSTDSPMYSTLTDDRDGKTYKTVKIGGQWWMAENLSYVFLLPTAEMDSSSFCRNKLEGSCEKYGRLYAWAAAMDSAGLWSTNGKGCGYGAKCSSTYPVRGICPEGWHLPTYVEFEKLIAAVGGSATAGKMLKSATDWKNGNGLDAYGFSALPIGGNEEINLGEFAFFLSSMEEDADNVFCMLLHDKDDAKLFTHTKNNPFFSIRCVKD